MRGKATLIPKLTIGLDLGDRISRTCEVDATGATVKEASVETTAEALQSYFCGRSGCRVVMEAGTHSPWISRLLETLGHEVIVANSAEVYGNRRRKRRNDQLDAEFLARQGRADIKLLHPIRHRTAQAQQHLEVIRARDQLVRVRTKLINHVRGSVKALGGRVERCSAEAFPRKAAAHIPDGIQDAVEPLLEMIVTVTKKIDAYDEQMKQVIADSYPDAAHVQQIRGVGPITALAFVLLVEDPKRFTRSRDVGAYFGLVPRLDESSSFQPQLRITKAGDELGRRLLVSAAQYIMGPFGVECDLRRHGEAIALRGGKNAKKRAVVAVARKLSVLMHRMIVTQAAYDPDYVIKRKAA